MNKYFYTYANKTLTTISLAFRKVPYLKKTSHKKVHIISNSERTYFSIDIIFKSVDFLFIAFHRKTANVFLNHFCNHSTISVPICQSTAPNSFSNGCLLLSPKIIYFVINTRRKLSLRNK